MTVNENGAGTSHARQVAQRFNREERHLLAILTEIQKANNSLTENDLIEVADELNIPVSRVYGVATFYSLYSLKPRGRYIIRICESAPCHVTGAPEVIQALEKELGIKMGETTPDGMFTLEFTSCLGLCGVAPVMMINDEVFGNLNAEKVVAILSQFRNGKEVAV